MRSADKAGLFLYLRFLFYFFAHLSFSQSMSNDFMNGISPADMPQ